MLDTLRDSLGRNASFKLALLLLLVAMLPCYCIGGILLVVSNNNRRVDPSPVTATAVALDSTLTPSVDAQPSITPMGFNPTSLPPLQPTPTTIDLNALTPGAYSTYDTSTLFPPEPVTTMAVTPGNIDSGSPVALCPDDQGNPSTVIRINMTNGTAPGANIHCRTLTNLYSIGSQTVIERGVIVAVDIYDLSGALSGKSFQQPLLVCLPGQGVFWFLDASGSPRTAVEQTDRTIEDGYTCASISNAGTVVLTYR